MRAICPAATLPPAPGRVSTTTLTEPAGQPVGDDARDDVARPTRREAVDERDGAIGPDALAPGRRRGAGREAGKRGAARDFGCARWRPHLGARRTRLPMTSSRLALFGVSLARLAPGCRARTLPETRGARLRSCQRLGRRRWSLPDQAAAMPAGLRRKRVRYAVSALGRRSGRPRAPCAC